MEIFEENGKIRLQLMEMVKGIMLFDFTIEKETFNELKDHIIEHLNKFSQEKPLMKENDVKADLIKIHIFMCHLIQHKLTPEIKTELEEFMKSWSLMLEV